MKFNIYTITAFVLLTIPAIIQANNLNFEEVKIMPDETNELRADVLVTLTDTANVFFRYKNVMLDSSAYLFTPVSKHSKNHALTLTTLTQLTTYKIEAVAFNKNNYITIDTFTFETGAVDERLNNFENVWQNGFYTTPQYTITNLPAGQESFFIVTDLRGNLVWYHKYNLDYNSCNAWRITAHNTILYANCKEIVEIDFFGNVLRNIVTEEPSWYFHHDLQYLSNGNLAVIYAHPETHFISGTGEEEIVIVDGYLVYNEANEIVYRWKASDFFDATEARFMGGYWSQIFGQRTLDWCHFNSIAEDFDNNLLISSSHWSKVFKVNRFNGEVIWELGEDGTLSKDSTFQIQRQHSIEPISPHKYLLFDNLGKDGLSRAVEFAVDPDTNFAFPFWEYQPVEEITAPTRGNIQRLPNGNTLVFFPTGKGTIHEVNPNRQLVWKIDLGRSGYRAYRVPHLVEPHQQVTIEINDTICSTEIPIELTTKPAGAYLMGDVLVDGQLLTQNYEGTTQTIKAVYGNNLVEKNIFIAPKESANIILNETGLELPGDYNNYQWYFEETPIENGIDAIFIPTESGAYYVSFENQYGCVNFSDTINYVKTNVLSFEESSNYKVITNNKVIEIYASEKSSKIVELYALDGKLLTVSETQNQSYKIPMHNFTGMFILKIKNARNIYIKKIVL